MILAGSLDLEAEDLVQTPDLLPLSVEAIG